jgi:hypothetical protein
MLRDRKQIYPFLVLFLLREWTRQANRAALATIFSGYGKMFG